MKVVVLLDVFSMYCVVFGPYTERRAGRCERVIRGRFRSPDWKVMVVEMRYPDFAGGGRMISERLQNMERGCRLDFAQWEELKASDAAWSVVLSVPDQDCFVYGPYTRDGAKIIAGILGSLNGVATRCCPRHTRKTLWLERRQ